MVISIFHVSAYIIKHKMNKLYSPHFSYAAKVIQVVKQQTGLTPNISIPPHYLLSGC